MTETVVVTGGAGYVGAHVCLALSRRGYRPVTLDDLSTGHRAAVRFGPLEVTDLAGGPLAEILARHAPVAVVHAAARSDVAASFAEPVLYRLVNVEGTRRLAEACGRAGVRNLLLLSSAAVYGGGHGAAIREEAPAHPISPYGRSKLEAERALAAACGLDWAALRLFNVAGAAAGDGLGEDHPHETHLVPLAIRAALGGGQPLRIYGGDHATPDATALRDYVHVLDVADAACDAVAYLRGGGAPGVFNIGSGEGTSVRAVVRAVERAAGRPVPLTVEPPRPGDPAVLVADCARARRMLGFRPRRSDIDRVVADALAWELARVAA